jgi:aminopeptidase C
MKKTLTLIAAALMAMPMAAQQTKKFTVVKQLPITSVKNQYRSGTCWDFATLGYFESEILRKTGKTYDLCEMFVVNKDYMDNATHYVRMHGYSQISDEAGKPYYLVKNSWGEYGPYKGIWYMSRDFMMLNTTYLFLNRHALPTTLQEALTKSNVKL